MNLLTQKIVGILALTTCTWTNALAGGGGLTGDGFPTGVPLEHTQLHALPAQDALLPLIGGIARELPTVSLLLKQALERFADVNSGYRAVHLQSDNAYFHASYEASRAEVNHVPQSAGISYWNGFFTLPLRDDAPEVLDNNHASQAKVTLHELIHILFAGSDEELTTTLTTLLYKLGIGAPLSLEELKFIHASIPAEALSSLESLNNSIQRLNLYVAARGLQTPCSDFGRTDLIQIAGRGFTFPKLPVGLRERLEVDPFYGFYRRYCLSTLPQGELLLAPLPIRGMRQPEDGAGLFRDPLLRAKLIHHITGKKIIISLNEDGIKVEDFENQIITLLEGRGRSVTGQDIENAVPGYHAWLNHFKATYPDLASPINSITLIDFFRLTTELIRIEMGELDSFRITGDGIVREDYEIKPPRRRVRVACREFQPTPYRTYFERVYFTPLELDCTFQSRFAQRHSMLSNQVSLHFTLLELLNYGVDVFPSGIYASGVWLRE